MASGDASHARKDVPSASMGNPVYARYVKQV
jgi:hypothetical protein